MVLSLRQPSEAEGKRVDKLLASHIPLWFSPEVGQLLVHIHTAGHHTSLLQFSDQSELSCYLQHGWHFTVGVDKCQWTLF